MKLWAITCLFNPAGYRIRPQNYHRFRDRLPLPLVTVELGYEDGFALDEGDADILIRVSGGARLWQKECLLNLAVRSLPPDCEGIVAMDADILFRNRTWPDQVAEALERWPVLQPFGLSVDVDSEGRQRFTRESAASVWPRGGDRLKRLGAHDEITGTHVTNGLVWAARRNIIDRYGFYDRCIIGGGDTAFISAAAGSQEVAIDRHRMGAEQRARYLSWADPVMEEIDGRVGFLPLEVEHLWHGTFENRQWMERHAKLREVGFDPNADVRLSEDGVLQWASNRPELHDLVRRYFESRSEDAALLEAPAR